MLDTFASLIPFLTFFSHLVLIFAVVALIFYRSWGAEFSAFIGRHALFLSFLISLAALIGSLFYSEVIGFEACVLCWWQRVFLYPLVVIFGLSLWKKDLAAAAFSYTVPLVLLGALVALYHSYASLGLGSLLPCTAEGGECSKVYVKALGYITIPIMSLTVSIYLLVLAYARKFYKN